MKIFYRIIAMALVLSLIASANIMSVAAEENTAVITSEEILNESMIEFNNNLEYYKNKYLSAEEIDAQLDEFTDNDVVSTFSLIEDVAISYKFRNLSKEERTQNKNFIEAVLDVNEGLSAFECNTALNLGDEALTTAQRKYPTSGATNGEQDAYRHFIWNYNMTKEIGKSEARIVGCNHEWGLLFATMGNVHTLYQNKYNIYISQGYTESNAEKTAYEDAIAFIPFSKDTFISTFTTFAKFQEIWDDDGYYMDFYNNCYGRAYGENWLYYYSCDDAYLESKNAGEVILSDNPIHCTYDKKWCVWGWDWYS